MSELTKLSASRIKTAQTCSWTYWCNYKLKLPDAGNDGASRGTICHNVFELLGDKHKAEFNKLVNSDDHILNSKTGKKEIIKIIQTLVKQRKESIELFTKGGRNELADIERNEINLLTNYLPQMISEEKIKNIVENVINEVSATSLSDMGKIMPVVMSRGRGLIDGKTAQKLVQELLG